MPFTQKIDKLPENGSLAPKTSSKANTLEDVVDGMYVQNKAINFIVNGMNELADMVKLQQPTVDKFKSIEALAKNALKWARLAVIVFGGSSIVEAIKWLATLHH